MNKCRTNIAILEPSLIVYEGLSNILLQESRIKYNLLYYDSLEEILPDLSSGELDLVIINPLLIRSDIKNFSHLKKGYNSVFWAGIIYSFCEKEILGLFEGIIQITDTVDVILETVFRLVSSNCNEERNTKEQLSQREIDVLKQLVQGLSNKEIADHLNISIHTVISHRKNIVQKTGIKSQAGLTIYAISNKIIDIESYQE